MLLDQSSKRAQRLSQTRLAKHEHRQEDEQQTNIVSFVLSGQRYGIKTDYVYGVISIGDVTPLPRTPSYFFGLYDLRGRLLPVLDLRGLLGLDCKVPPTAAWAIACGDAEPEFLILADAISSVMRLAPHAPLSAIKGSDPADWVRWITADGMKLLDGAALLNDQRFILDAQAGHE